MSSDSASTTNMLTQCSNHRMYRISNLAVAHKAVYDAQTSISRRWSRHLHPQTTEPQLLLEHLTVCNKTIIIVIICSFHQSVTTMFNFICT